MFELVGIMCYDFTDEHGKRVQGTKIYFLTDPTPEQKKNGFTGKIAGEKSFPAGSMIPSAISCGKIYEFIMTYTGGKHPKLLGFREVKA